MDGFQWVTWFCMGNLVLCCIGHVIIAFRVVFVEDYN